jgi:hypothetical protein
LKFVSRAGDGHKQKEIYHIAHGHFRLAHANSFHEDVSIASSFAQENCFSRVLGYASLRTTGRRGANECLVACSEELHPSFVAKDASATNPAGRIHCKHRDVLVPFRDQVLADGFDQAALANARCPRYSDTDGIVAAQETFFDDLLSKFPIGLPGTLNQSDGLRQHRTITAEDSVEVLVESQRTLRNALRTCW